MLIKYHDQECVNMFRDGCSIIGTLATTGNGSPLCLDGSEYPDAASLASARASRNTALVSSLREDAHSASLLKMAADDARHHRMSLPRRLRREDLTRYTLSPRFCIEQGAQLLVLYTSSGIVRSMHC